jgi:hypothetical protein
MRPAPPPLSATAVVSRLGHGLADDDYVGHVERRAAEAQRRAAMVGVVRCRAGVGCAGPVGEAAECGEGGEAGVTVDVEDGPGSTRWRSVGSILIKTGVSRRRRGAVRLTVCPPAAPRQAGTRERGNEAVRAVTPMRQTRQPAAQPLTGANWLPSPTSAWK